MPSPTGRSTGASATTLASIPKNTRVGCQPGSLVPRIQLQPYRGSARGKHPTTCRPNLTSVEMALSSGAMSGAADMSRVDRRPRREPRARGMTGALGDVARTRCANSEASRPKRPVGRQGTFVVLADDYSTPAISRTMSSSVRSVSLSSTQFHSNAARAACSLIS